MTSKDDLDQLFHYIPAAARHHFVKAWENHAARQQQQQQLKARDVPVPPPSFLVKLQNGWPVAFFHVYVFSLLFIFFLLLFYLCSTVNIYGYPCSLTGKYLSNYDIFPGQIWMESVPKTFAGGASGADGFYLASDPYAYTVSIVNKNYYFID